MNKKKCPKCGSVKTKKNGQRNGVQLYTCTVCNHQFWRGSKVSSATGMGMDAQHEQQD